MKEVLFLITLHFTTPSGGAVSEIVCHYNVVQDRCLEALEERVVPIGTTITLNVTRLDWGMQ